MCVRARSVNHRHPTEEFQPFAYCKRKEKRQKGRHLCKHSPHCSETRSVSYKVAIMSSKSKGGLTCAVHDTEFQPNVRLFLLGWFVARGTRSLEHDLKLGTNYHVPLLHSARITRRSAVFLLKELTFSMRTAALLRHSFKRELVTSSPHALR